MVEFNVRVNRGLDGKFRKLEQLIDNFREEYLMGLAEEIVFNSPVDTGAYILSHNIGDNFTTSDGVGGRRDQGDGPFGAKWSQLQQPALSKLDAQIRAIPDTQTVVTIRNTSSHATIVEYQHGYEVYSRARAKSGMIAREAEARARARSI
jgi:hypothetical protein